MRLLQVEESSLVQAGMSHSTLIGLEGGAVGVFMGALIGGLLTAPIYYNLVNNPTISLPHHIAGLMILAMGATFGALLGSIMGLSGGYFAAYQMDPSIAPK